MSILPQNNLTFAETYLLASKVKDKLTREAINPKTNLRLLVCQANLLDNLMDTLQNRNEAAPRYQPEKTEVTFRGEPSISLLGNDSVVTTTELSDSDEEYDDDYDDESDYSSSSEDDYTIDVEFTQYQRKLQEKKSNEEKEDDRSDDEELLNYSSDDLDSESEDEENDDREFKLQKLRRFYSSSVSDKDNLPQLAHCSSASSSECDEEEEEYAVAVEGKDAREQSYANHDPMMMVHAIEQGRPSADSVVVLY